MLGGSQFVPGNTICVFPHYLCLGGSVCTLAVTLFVLLQHYLCLGGTICGLGGTPVVIPWIGIGTGLGIGVEGARRTQYARGATLRRPMRKVREGRMEDNPEHAPPHVLLAQGSKKAREEEENIRKTPKEDHISKSSKGKRSKKYQVHTIHIPGARLYHWN